MSIQLHHDTINTAWGDTRAGALTIWFQRMSTDGIVLSVQQLTSEIAGIAVFPNPTSSVVHVEGQGLQQVVVRDVNSRPYC